MSIALIAPYESLAYLCRSICQEMGFNVPVHTASMEDGLRLAKSLMAEGVDFLISRGMTAELIRAECPIPVAELEVSSFDIYLCLEPLLKRNMRIGVVGHSDILRKAKGASAALGFSIDFYAAGQPETMGKIMEQARRQNIEAIAGDAVAAETARRYGMEGVLVENGADSVTNTLQYAVATHVYLTRQATMSSRLQVVLDRMDGGALLASPTGELRHCNAAVRAMLEENQNCAETTLDELFPELDWRAVPEGRAETVRALIPVKDSKLSVNVTAHVHEGQTDALICTFHDIQQIEQLEHSFRKSAAPDLPTARHTFETIVHNSPAMQHCITRAKQFSSTHSSILLVGETGTGKELFAQSIHNHSPRAQGNFVAINCGALPEDLLESELFGYVGGAFTGALKSGKAGMFELAHNGTLFLDEINATSPKLQTRLLRTLQEREVMRVGSTAVIPVNVRVIAATNAPLEAEVNAGRFRADLFYRLNVLDIRIPPLRERPEDILLLFGIFLERFSAELNRSTPAVTDVVRRQLLAHPWPGNVRELQNYAEKFSILYPEEAALSSPEARQAQPEVFHNAKASADGWHAPLPAAGGRAPYVAQPAREVAPDAPGKAWLLLEGTLDHITRAVIQQIVQEEGGNLSKAARRLDISRNTLRRKLEEGR
ncbi:sigma 54-interacting transcriptional regulator [Oleidesulfovibrio sp.]|uniref:sigma 54-interacting transcriptional regulator n=1 Tax=Oleidesulfovibrio sp. TaxID=2909707 RepID=UPI003A85C7F7